MTDQDRALVVVVDQPYVAVQLLRFGFKPLHERGHGRALDRFPSAGVQRFAADQIDPVPREPPVEQRVVRLVLVRPETVVTRRVATVLALVLELSEILAGRMDQLQELIAGSQVRAVASAVL